MFNRKEKKPKRPKLNAKQYLASQGVYVQMTNTTEEMHEEGKKRFIPMTPASVKKNLPLKPN